MSKELQGYVALVTGGPRNIGRAMALAFAEQGASVVITAVNDMASAESAVKEIEDKGASGLAVQCDVTKEGDVAALRDRIEQKFGRLDVLVNNAAVRHEQPFGEMTYAQWRHVIGVTLDGAFLTASAMLPMLKASGRGAIVNIGGMSAYTGAKKRVHVLAAKSGLGGLTRGLAHDLAEFGVTANLVSPGLIDTVRGGHSAKEPDHHKHHATLLGRRGRPEEVADMVVWLSGPHARYVTGQTIHVNGGAYLPT
ncbi:MAG: SDR family NAD(P)-dependent oxidoreductase [Beijerinckiaceae bacterium]